MARSIVRLWRRRTNRSPALAHASRFGTQDELRHFVGSEPDGQDVGGVELPVAVVVQTAVSANGTTAAAHDDPWQIDNFTSRQRVAVCPCPLWKRAMDVVGALVALVALSPALLAVAAMIKCVSRGPVLFRQRRYGLGGRPFTMWKFRTIETGESPEQHHSHVTGLMERDAPLRKLDGKLAVIPGGAVLRKLGLDELPQLFNVLKGEMSLVGPRPDVLPPEKYQLWQRVRFDALPGITGLWQVSGKNRTTFSGMILFDINYIRRRSVWLDLLIIAKTIPSILWG